MAARACVEATGASHGRLPILFAGRQFLLLDREDGSSLHLDPTNNADTAADVFEPGVVGAGPHAGDPQTLIRIDGAILVVLALVRAPVRGAGGRQGEFGNRMPREIPKARRPI